MTDTSMNGILNMGELKSMIGEARTWGNLIPTLASRRSQQFREEGSSPNEENQMKRPHSCKRMKEMLESQCDHLGDPFQCADKLVVYIPKFDEYGLIVHDGGSSYIMIKFCPWCGARLPRSKRDKWFDKLKSLGFEDPTRQRIPKEFLSDKWYSKTKRAARA